MLCRNIVSIRQAHKTAGFKPIENVSKLSSGLTVATIDKNGPLTQLVLAFKAGSRYEQPNQTGLSHTLRNFVGRDTEKYFGSNIVWTSSAVGATLKSFTTREVFGVSLTVPRDQISTALSILGQVAAVPGFKPWEVEDVLPTMHADNGFRTHYDFVFDGIHKAAYRNAGLGNPIFSPCSQIGAVCTKTLAEFAAKHFVTGNAVLFATNAKHEDVVLYGDNYSPIQKGNDVTAPQSPYKGGEYRLEADTKYANVIIAGEGASGRNAKALATQAVLLNLLGNSSPVKFSSSVNNVLNKNSELSGTATAFQAVHSDSGLVGVYLVAPSGEVRKAVHSVVGALKALNVDGVESAKKQAYYNALRANAHSNNFAIEKASQLFFTQDNYVDHILNVNASDVEAAAKKLVSKLSLASYGNISEVPYVDEL